LILKAERAKIELGKRTKCSPTTQSAKEVVSMQSAEKTLNHRVPEFVPKGAGRRKDLAIWIQMMQVHHLFLNAPQAARCEVLSIKQMSVIFPGLTDFKCVREELSLFGIIIRN
jgi:hypothetical protein